MSEAFREGLDSGVIPSAHAGEAAIRTRQTAPSTARGAPLGMRRLSRTVEHEIAMIAGRQHGVVARRQLLDAGISCPAVDRRMRKGLLLAAYPGIYYVGHRASRVEAQYMAAVLAGGKGAWVA